MSYWTMRRRIELMKKASGAEAIEIPDEIIELEANINRAKAELRRLQQAKASDQDIAKAALALNSLELRMRTLIAQKKLM